MVLRLVPNPDNRYCMIFRVSKPHRSVNRLSFWVLYSGAATCHKGKWTGPELATEDALPVSEPAVAMLSIANCLAVLFKYPCMIWSSQFPCCSSSLLSASTSSCRLLNVVDSSWCLSDSAFSVATSDECAALVFARLLLAAVRFRARCPGRGGGGGDGDRLCGCGCRGCACRLALARLELSGGLHANLRGGLELMPDFAGIGPSDGLMVLFGKIIN